MGLWGRLTGLGTGMTKKEILAMNKRQVSEVTGIPVSEIGWVEYKTDGVTKTEYFIRKEAKQIGKSSIRSSKRVLDEFQELLNDDTFRKNWGLKEEKGVTEEETCNVCGESYLEHTVTNLGHVFKSPSLGQW